MILSHNGGVVVPATPNRLDRLLLNRIRSGFVGFLSNTEQNYIFAAILSFACFIMDVPDFCTFAGYTINQGGVAHNGCIYQLEKND
jgi:hypothetical protein